MEPLTEEQINFAINQVATWIRTKHEFETFGTTINEADPEHSSLLPYLLRGNEPFENPPPLRFSQPDYKLASGEPVEIFDISNLSLASILRKNVEPHEELTLTHDEEGVIIDQYADWKWEDEKKGILIHKRSGDKYLLQGKILQKMKDSSNV